MNAINRFAVTLLVLFICSCSSEQDADLAIAEQAKPEIVTLAAGYVVDENGNSMTKYASVQLQNENPNYLELKEPRWSGGAYHFGTVRDGSFHIEGEVGEGPYLLSFFHEDYAPVALPITLGDEGIVLNLQKACKASGKVLLDEKIDPTDLRIYFLTPGQAALDIVNEMETSTVLSKKGFFNCKGLPSGLATLVVSGILEPTPLYTRALDLGDPGNEIQVADIDLRGKLKMITLTPIVPAGTFVYGPWARTLDGELLDARGTHGLSFLTDKESLDLEVGANGFGNLILMDVDGDREFTLPPGIQIEVLISNAPSLPENCYWVCTVTPMLHGKRLADKHGTLLMLENGSSASAGLRAPGEYQMVVSIADWRGDITAGGARPIQIGNDARQPIWEVKDQDRKQVFRHELTNQEIRQAEEYLKAGEVAE